MPTPPPLASIFDESIAEVLHREQTALEKLLDQSGRRVVLFGCGNLGRRAAEALGSLGIVPLAFSDNNPQRWGTRVGAIEILSPQDAARYGEEAAFLVTIWNEFHWFSETEHQLRGLGCRCVLPYTYLHWRFPEVFLPCLLNDLPSKVYQEKDRVLAAWNLFKDAESQRIYQSNIRLRTLGELTGLPPRPVENTYLPKDIFSITEQDRLLDCGATVGEMLRDLLEKTKGMFGGFYAVEADNISFPKLQEYRQGLLPDVRERVKLFQCAVGRVRETVFFAHSGQTGSKISTDGSAVDCFPIDELFAETPLTFIKMDIEGAEYDALRGAEQVIRRDRPILAICVYHTQSDIWRIPLLIYDMKLNYKFFLRAYEGDGFQTVLYAVPPERLVAPSAKL